MSIVHITSHSGKMTGIESISTSTSGNPFCRKMQKCEGSVCTRCYAKTYEKMRPALVTALERNTMLLKGRVLSDRELPVINANIFRFSSFGDLHNTVHAINLVNVAEKNPATTFAIWTKRPRLLQAAFRKVGKPTNLIAIYSAPMIDQEPSLPKNFDKTFTVFTKGKASEVGINCGAKSCVTCRVCYTKGGAVQVREKLK